MAEHQTACFPDVGGEHALSCEDPPCSGNCLALRVHHLVNRIGFLGFVLQHKGRVVLQLLSDPGQIAPHFKPMFLQLPSWSGAGQYEGLRRMDCANAKDDIPGCMGCLCLAFIDEGNATGLVAGKFQMLDECARQQGKIGPCEGGAQMGSSGTAAPAIPSCAIISGNAFRVAAIEIIRIALAGLDCLPRETRHTVDYRNCLW